MTTQKQNADLFRDLHVKGSPIILFNIWDAGSAKVIEEAGAKAIATGSWSVAAANGFADGQALPFDIAIANLERIVRSVDLPVTLDLEGGYATDDSQLEENIKRVIDAGAIGINFEDQIIGGDGLYSIEKQCSRISAIHSAASGAGVPLFINARTDVFLKTYPAAHTDEQLDEAIRRAVAYAESGASGLFAPGLRAPKLIEQLCSVSPVPVNIMVLPDAPPAHELADLGVARISHGPGPYRAMTNALKEAAEKVFAEIV
jgi:2-methylisocitrate lyase-like PEP mutase family enzyme